MKWTDPCMTGTSNPGFSVDKPGNEFTDPRLSRGFALLWIFLTFWVRPLLLSSPYFPLEGSRDLTKKENVSGSSGNCG